MGITSRVIGINLDRDNGGAYVTLQAGPFGMGPHFINQTIWVTLDNVPSLSAQLVIEWREC